MRRTIKITAIIGFLMAITLLFSGCGEKNNTSGMFVCIGRDSGVPVWNKIYYDKETKVMYLGTESGLAVMLNADGTPKLYKEAQHGGVGED